MGECGQDYRVVVGVTTVLLYTYIMMKFLTLLLIAPLLLSGCMRTPTHTAVIDTHKYSAVTFKEFFPSISGHIADYSVQLPAGYTSYVIPSGFKKSDVIWGTAEDLKAILLSKGTYDFGKATNPMFKVSFTPNVGVEDGKIIDPNGPVTKEDFEQQGVTQLKFISGDWHGLDGVPALAMTGEKDGEQLYLAYIYSPVNDLVMFVLLQGNRDGATDDQAWVTFVRSLEIQ